ncbi:MULTISPECIES: nucleotidyltransferase substrate binding protein [unclassified Wenzhouxiangella]|uniref:nucleotidyltransferase substrate binding protein n=1 Tax=unclassified Wenzhouxiangella TaxID=2613841 RepID=UPI000E3286D7|nr:MULTISPECIES: nucleotidyltransferase substrate binding protein [unclassified Wenzhouxiangella]RFF27857.1 nucleotidyltransferase [Wenzhouxiangella sp. 15181]RFP69016.1 nucleotidyltransferase [Wenzhouxiangella sp. 15190]
MTPRWIQRLDNYKRAHAQLKGAVDLMRRRELSDLEKQGVIQAFEFTWELAWNLLKDYLNWQGETEITGARDAIREAFSRELIEKGQVWMAMLQDRNRTAHTYNESTMREILTSIDEQYIEQLDGLKRQFQELAEKHG